jgi:hypothetical protein
LTDPFSALAKNKKKTELPKPERVTTHFAKSKPSSPSIQKPQKPQVKKVQAPKVQPVQKQHYHAKPKQQQRTQQQAPEYNPEDFKFHTAVDNIGINILVKYQDIQIYQFVLPATDYELYQRRNSWSQKYEYVKMKVNPSCFMNNNQLVHSVIKTIVHILDTLFAKAREIQAQSLQNQRQQTRTQNGRF